MAQSCSWGKVTEDQPFDSVFNDFLRGRVQAVYETIENAHTVGHPAAALTNHLRVQAEQNGASQNRHTHALRHNDLDLQRL